MQTISAFLSAEDEWSPMPLAANAGKSFIGSYVLGMGFTMSLEEAQAHIARDARNAEVLFPYLNGEDLNSHPQQLASRWVINFWDWPLDRSIEDEVWASADERQRGLWLREGRVPADYPGRVAADFPDLLRTIETAVKPERQRRDEQGNFALRSPLPQRWWHYADKRPALYHAIGRGGMFARHPEGWSAPSSGIGRVMVNARVTRHFTPSFCTFEPVFHEKVVVLVLDTYAELALMNSSLVQAWVWNFSSTMKRDLNFSPSDCFETLPFPLTLPEQLESLGVELSRQRAACMTTRNVGLTEFNNAVHDPSEQSAEIRKFRECIRQIDELVVAAFGWPNNSLGHGFHQQGHLPAGDDVRFTLSEVARLDVLRRLSKLNRQRYKEEQDAARGLEAAQAEHAAPRKLAGRSAAKKAAATGAQTPLF